MRSRDAGSNSWILVGVLLVVCGLFSVDADATTYGQHYGVVDQWYTEGGTGSMDMLLKNLGAKWIRSGWDWDYIEGPGDDQYEPNGLFLMDSWVHGMNILGVNIYHNFNYTPSWARPPGTKNNTPPTDPTRYTDYITFMVNRYKHGIHHWGFWNEPNLSGFWNSTINNYIHNLLLPGIVAVKAADPTAKCVVGELATYGDDIGVLRTMLQECEAHGLKDMVDVVSTHGYGSNRVAHMDAVHDMMVSIGWGDKDFWMTETGTHSGGSNSEDYQAAWLMDMMQGMDARPWWKKSFWFTLGEGGDGESGLTRPDQSLKPAYLQYQAWIAEHADDAEQVWDNIPATMVVGRQYYVGIKVNNSGTTTWQESQQYKLGAVGDSDPFADTRQYLNSGESVATDATRTFWFTMTAPATTGTYTTDWQMVRDGVRWFGHPLTKQVTVTSGPDNTPPASPSSFAAAPGDYKVTLTWQNPPDADFTGTMIRFKTTGYPTGLLDGSFVVDKANTPTSSDSFVHTGRTNGVTYYYSALAHDSVGNYSTVASASATAIDNEPPGPADPFTVTSIANQNTLFWTNPTASDFAMTMVRFRTDTFPAGPEDGTLLCNQSASPGSSDSYTHTGLPNGTTYYYSAFSRDEIPNYSTANASGTPLGSRENINNSEFNLNLQGWTASAWKAGTAENGLINYAGGAGRTGGGVRCNGGGITDDDQRCLREGGEIQKTISTVGYHRIGISYDLRVNNLGGNYTGAGTGGCTVDHNLIDEQLTVFYSTNGGTDWIEAEYITRNALLNYQTYGTRTIDLSSVIACDENPNFALRFRWQLNRDLDAADLDNIIVSGNATGPPDTTPPGQLQTFTATKGNGQVSLGWRNPTTNDFVGTMIRFKTTGYPTDSADGDLVCNKTKTPDSFDNYVHTGLTNGLTYYYSAFCYDEVPNYSAGSQANVTLADTTPPSNVSNFTATVGNTRNTLAWTNPSTSDFTGTMIRFKTTGYPSSSTDGTLVIDKTNTPSSTDSYIHSGLTNGITYYYKAFAHDAAPNYASGVTASAVPAYFDSKDAKLSANNTVLTLTHGAISAAFADFFYVQNPDVDRPLFGIRINKTAHGLVEGYLVGATGTALTDDTTGEKYLSATWAGTSVTAAVSAKSMSNAAIGGVDWNYNDSNKAGQRGVVGGIGPNNTGLLVRVWGKVTQRQPTGPNKYFYINDGSSVIDATDTDGAANVGVRVSADPTGYETDEYVVVTGVVSCFRDASGNIRRLILPKAIQEL